ncbi:MAG: hypothetical protein E6700_09600 [Winkia neuii]|nr:hypothetical protein [Winkia neuii]MDK8753953.1 hypothetical protein [Actinomycetaceae bacterium UMB8039A]MDU3135809.1 hypothetical protein [Winkia neuii]NJJ16439.1 helix-turn-helix domain-containing protein [Winkia neuii]OFT55553.1 hypothetical protein HMPREF3152_04615 [Actinomyces sp. HMSC06A08]
MKKPECPITGEPLKNSRTISERAEEMTLEALRQLPGLHENALQAAYRLVKPRAQDSGSGGSDPAERLPYNPELATKVRVAEGPLFLLAKKLGPAERGYFHTTCEILADQLPNLIVKEEAAVIAEQVRTSYMILERVADLPLEKYFYGTCDAATGPHETLCEKAIYAPKGRRTVTCPKCHTAHDAGRLLEQAHKKFSEYALTIPHIVRLLDSTAAGPKVKLKTVYKWAERGKLKPVRRNHDGLLYSVAQVLRLAENHVK